MELRPLAIPNRARISRRIVTAARVSLSTGGSLDQWLISDICERLGLSTHAFRQLFPTADALLDAVHEALVDECSSRLRACIDQFVASATPAGVTEAASLLAKSWPLDRGGLIIRGERRVRAMAGGLDGPGAARSERKFLGALVDIFTDLMTRIGRRFEWDPMLAVRVILDTYERSFEAWILDGHSELTFADSPYIARTLPTLLEQLSQSVANDAPQSGSAAAVA
ncbi:AcrR family transcriptional regulator [Frigoribacterium sp. UYMn621]